MSKLLLSLICVGFLIHSPAAPDVCEAQLESELEVGYVFWSSPKFKLDGGKSRSVMGLFSTSFKQEFLVNFDQQAREYELVQRARKKLNFGNWMLAVPAGICLGIAIAKDSDAAPLFIAGSVLAVGDIVIGISAYKDLSKAAELRNQRLMPTVSIAF